MDISDLPDVCKFADIAQLLDVSEYTVKGYCEKKGLKFLPFRGGRVMKQDFLEWLEKQKCQKETEGLPLSGERKRGRGKSSGLRVARESGGQLARHRAMKLKSSLVSSS